MPRYIYVCVCTFQFMRIFDTIFPVQPTPGNVPVDLSTNSAGLHNTQIHHERLVWQVKLFRLIKVVYSKGFEIYGKYDLVISS